MLREEILTLIDEKREGTYWDFKQKYHKDKGRLLHDIICLANNVNNRDAYLIFGISDEGKIVGIEEDENRKNQEHFTSFLRGKKFSGGTIPYVILKTLFIQDHEIDVLIIKRSDEIPYYLAEPFRDGKTNVSAGSIYLRIEDQNTPINSTADPIHTEQLWKYRLGILPLPLERLRRMLCRKNSWKENQNGFFFEEAPEFTIVENKEVSESYDRGLAPFYAYNQTNSSCSYHQYECRYHTTVLYETQTISLDSGRFHTPIPEFGFIPIDKNNRNSLDYRYFVNLTTKFYLHHFMFDEKSDEAFYSRRKLLRIVPIFESEGEKNSFEDYIVENMDETLEKMNIDIDEEEYLDIEDDNLRINKMSQRSLSIGTVLVKSLEDFRKARGWG